MGNSQVSSPEVVVDDIEDCICETIECTAGSVELRWYEEVSSTMTVARELAHSGALANLSAQVVTAARQHQGRGRQGRVWSCTEGALATTLIVPLAKSTQQYSGLSLAVGLGLVKALRGLGATGLGVKWPNDLYDAIGRKCAGILTELITLSDGTLITLIGIGMNLTKAPAGIDDTCSLSDVGVAPHTPKEILPLLIADVLNSIVAIERGGFSEIAEEWLNCAWGVGRRFSVLPEGNNSTVQRSGLFVGVAPTGALLLKDDNSQTHTIHSGHVVAVK